MAAYAAVTSLMHILDEHHNHHSPPISLDTQQAESLNEIAAFLQKFLQVYDSPFAYSDEADPLEIRIMNAASAAEDAIESHIVKVIKTTTAYLEKRAMQIAMKIDSKKDDDDDSEEEEQTESTSFEEEDDGDDAGEETRSTKSNSVKEETRSISINLYEDPHQVIEEVDSVEEDDDDDDGEMDSVGTGSTKSNSVKEETRSISSEEVNSEVSCINLYEDLHQVIEEMNSIKKLAMMIDTDKDVVRSSSTEQRPNTAMGPNTVMVCSDDVILEIMDKLVSGSRHRQVIPITGMGGIGKTTLARAVYSKLFVQKHFDVCVWVTISQKFNTREILCELLCQASKTKKQELSEDDAGSALHKYLFNRRFLIVMDDMRSIDAWDAIQRYFPDNENSSRVLVTTRLSGLTSQLTNDYSLEMKFLDGVRSWELFSKTVFEEESCPPELEQIGKKIVHDCKGLPLSIVVVGGALKKVEQTRERWKSITAGLTSVVNLENDQHCLKLLKLSYNHLPVYLKPCFLYMGVFKEDDQIRASRLVKLWVSEGFLKPTNGESLETTAERFLRDLIDRNLVLIDGLTCRGHIKYCRMHDLVRDLCLREGGKYGFYNVMGQCSIGQGINSQRRLVIPYPERERALLFYPLARSIICAHGNISSCQSFGLLRILYASKLGEYGNVNYIDVDRLAFECVNLRHIAVDVKSMSLFLLSSMVLAWNLHTLIVESYYECETPVEIWKMPQLRHIEFKGGFYLPADSMSDRRDDRVVVMENLHIFKGVRNFRCGEEVLMRCPNLRKLGIIYFNPQDIHYSLINIECFSKLESLSIEYGDDSLYELTFPNSLKSLSLCLFYGNIELEDILGKIGLLHFLQKLKLSHGCFGTGNWEIAEDQFPFLKYLSLSYCHPFKHWTAAQESSSIFPRLEHLHLHRIIGLERIPSEIGEIPTLQKIELDECCESVVMSVRDIVEEQVDLQEEDLSFHVVVRPWEDQRILCANLACPHFEVTNF